MSKAMHTPGPWFIGETNPYEDGINEIAIMARSPSGKFEAAVALTIEFQNLPEMQKANTHLIAAAPEILEALKETISQSGWRGIGTNSSEVYYCEFCDKSHEHFKNIEHTEECLITKNKSIIAKAEGK